jgi:hypothetical protein
MMDGWLDPMYIISCLSVDTSLDDVQHCRRLRIRHAHLLISIFYSASIISIMEEQCITHIYLYMYIYIESSRHFVQIQYIYIYIYVVTTTTTTTTTITTTTIISTTERLLVSTHLYIYICIEESCWFVFSFLLVAPHFISLHFIPCFDFDSIH